MLIKAKTEWLCAECGYTVIQRDGLPDPIHCPNCFDRGFYAKDFSDIPIKINPGDTNPFIRLETKNIFRKNAPKKA